MFCGVSVSSEDLSYEVVCVELCEVVVKFELGG